MHECEDPRARLRAFGAERRGRPPDAEEAFLHGVLREPLVAQDAEREAVGDAAHPVVELRECGLVSPRDERDQGFVREVGVLLCHRGAGLRLGQS